MIYAGHNGLGIGKEPMMKNGTSVKSGETAAAGTRILSVLPKLYVEGTNFKCEPTYCYGIGGAAAGNVHLAFIAYQKLLNEIITKSGISASAIKEDGFIGNDTVNVTRAVANYALTLPELKSSLLIQQMANLPTAFLPIAHRKVAESIPPLRMLLQPVLKVARTVPAVPVTLPAPTEKAPTAPAPINVMTFPAPEPGKVLTPQVPAALPPVHGLKLWPWIVGGIGIVVLGAGGYYLLRRK